MSQVCENTPRTTAERVIEADVWIGVGLSTKRACEKAGLPRATYYAFKATQSQKSETPGPLQQAPGVIDPQSTDRGEDTPVPNVVGNDATEEP